MPRASEADVPPPWWRSQTERPPPRPQIRLAAGSRDHGRGDALRDLAGDNHRPTRFTSNLLSSWITSFAIAVAVAIPTAIVVAARAQRLVGRLTGTTLQRRGYCGSARSTDS